MKSADTQASLTGQLLHRNLPMKVGPDIALHCGRAEAVPVEGSNLPVNHSIGHAIQNTGRQMAMHCVIIGRPVKLACGELNQRLQAAVRNGSYAGVRTLAPCARNRRGRGSKWQGLKGLR